MKKAKSILPLGGAITAGAATRIIGDADNDGTISVLDATTIQMVLADYTIDNYNEASADADGSLIETIKIPAGIRDPRGYSSLPRSAESRSGVIVSRSVHVGELSAEAFRAEIVFSKVVFA